MRLLACHGRARRPLLAPCLALARPTTARLPARLPTLAALPRPENYFPKTIPPQVLGKVTEAVAENLYDMAVHKYATHVARRLLSVLAGREVAPAPGRKQQQQHAAVAAGDGDEGEGGAGGGGTAAKVGALGALGLACCAVLRAAPACCCCSGASPGGAAGANQRAFSCWLRWALALLRTLKSSRFSYESNKKRQAARWVGSL